MFVAVLGIGSLVNIQRHLHARLWIPAVARVEKVETLCQVEHDYGTRWRVMAVLDCDDAPTYVEERVGIDSFGWRSREKEYATITYEAGGDRRSARILRFLVSSVPVEAGDRVAIVVDPADPGRLDRPNGPGDRDVIWWAVGIGASIWASLVLLVWMVAHVHDGSPGAPGRPRRPASGDNDTG